MSENEDLLSTQEAADKLHVSKQTVQRWAKNGELEAIKLPSGTYKIKMSTINRILEGK